MCFVLKLNDDYYNNYASTITDYQQPQLEDQFGEVRGKLIAALTQRGMLASTEGARQLTNLEKSYADQTATTAAEAQDAATELRGRVENQRSDLYALNQASADPAAASPQAIGQATALAAPESISPVARVFDGFLEPLTAYRTASNNSPTTTRTSTARTASGAGSSRTVG